MNPEQLQSLVSISQQFLDYTVLKHEGESKFYYSHKEEFRAFCYPSRLYGSSVDFDLLGATKIVVWINSQSTTEPWSLEDITPQNLPLIPTIIQAAEELLQQLKEQQS